MRLSIRYENQFQSIELNEEETQEMWVSLSLEGENLEKEKLIQKTFDEKFNKPEYKHLAQRNQTLNNS